MTREQWLITAVERLSSNFEAAGYSVPEVQVSVGWPSRSALARKQRRIGECWCNSQSDDGKYQIFISPMLGDVVEVLATLVHELIHASIGVKEKHNKRFAKAAKALGLDGKPTATVAGEELAKTLAELAKSIGEFSHSPLKPSIKEKKQGTRMIKCECQECGYVVRTTKKWLEEIGAPICPIDKIQFGFELPDDDESDDDESDDE